LEDEVRAAAGSSFDALGRWPFYAEVVVGWLLRISGADRDRTGDPLVANQVLSQLSYRPEGLAS
jgi:hypothetical protein